MGEQEQEPEFNVAEFFITCLILLATVCWLSPVGLLLGLKVKI